MGPYEAVSGHLYRIVESPAQQCHALEHQGESRSAESTGQLGSTFEVSVH
jgi:hypothetical protein